MVDAGGVDAGLGDAGRGDAGTVDAGVLDAGAIDAGVLDAGIADAGPPCSRCLNCGAESNVDTVATTALKSAVYKATAPLSFATPAVMTKVADLAVPDGSDLPLTGGDIDPCGTSVLLRSYSAIYQLTGTGSFDAIFTGAFTRVPSPPLSLSASAELQGEAITWMPAGGYLTVSEGASQTLHRVSCQ